MWALIFLDLKNCTFSKLCDIIISFGNNRGTAFLVRGFGFLYAFHQDWCNWCNCFRKHRCCHHSWSAENMIFGLKTEDSGFYSTTYYTKIYNTPNEPTNTAVVNVPQNSIVTFEFVTLLGGGLGGLNHAIVVE